MRKEIPIVISSLALVISIASYFNTLDQNSFDWFKEFIGFGNSAYPHDVNRIIPKISIEVKVPYLDLPTIIRTSSDSTSNCVKALLVDEDNTDMTDNQTTFTTCTKMSSFITNKLHVLLLTNGMLGNLRDLVNVLNNEKDKYALKLIDLSDNTIRPVSRETDNAIAIKDVLLHVEKHNGVLILIRNPIVSETEILEAIAEIYPNAFLRLIWMPESFFIDMNPQNDSWLKAHLARLYPRFRLSYIDLIIKSHRNFYTWTHSLGELQREELHHLY